MHRRLLLSIKQQAVWKALLREISLRCWLATTVSIISREIARADHPRDWVIRSNSAAARWFRLSGRNRSGPPRAAKNRACNGMELRGDVLFANLLIPTRWGKRVFARPVANQVSYHSLSNLESTLFQPRRSTETHVQIPKFIVHRLYKIFLCTTNK